MPIFPGPVRHNNPDDAILDLTKRQVVGIGIFEDITTAVTGRNALHANMRTKGYIATLTGANVTHAYTGATTTYDDWIDTNNWSTIGGSGLPSGGEEDDVLTSISGNATWRPTINTTALTVKNHSVNPGDSEIIFSKKDTGSGAFTEDGDILGRIKAEGFDSSGNVKLGNPSITFVASDSSGSHSYFQSSSIKLGVSGSNVQFTGLEISGDRKIVVSKATDSQVPEPAYGGFYYNSTQDSYFVGRNSN
tara:strand:+ start:1211 stop:1954 length:744 start_codon:yes stop_codon:yes gene_type:complete